MDPLDVYETRECVDKLRQSPSDVSAQLKTIVQHCLGLVSVQRWLRGVAHEDRKLNVEHVVNFATQFMQQKLAPSLDASDAHFAELSETIAALGDKALARGSIRFLVRDELPHALDSQFVSFVGTADSLARAWAAAGAQDAVVDLIQENTGAMQSLLETLKSLAGAKKRKRGSDGDEDNEDSAQKPKAARTGSDSCKDPDQASGPRDDDKDNDKGTGGGGGGSNGPAPGSSADASSTGAASKAASNGNSEPSSSGSADAAPMDTLDLGDGQSAVGKRDQGPLFTMKSVGPELELRAAKSIVQLVYTVRTALDNSPSLKRSLRDTAIVIDGGGAAAAAPSGPGSAQGAGRLSTTGGAGGVSQPNQTTTKRPKVGGASPQGALASPQQQQIAALGVLGSLLSGPASSMDPRVAHQLLAQLSNGLLNPLQLAQLMQWAPTELPLRVALQPCASVHKSTPELEPLGVIAFGLEVSSADLAHNEVVTIKVIRLEDARPVQIFEHVIDGEPRFVFRAVSVPDPSSSRGASGQAPAASSSSSAAKEPMQGQSSATAEGVSDAAIGAAFALAGKEPTPFARSTGSYSARRLFARLQVSANLVADHPPPKAEYVLAVSVGNSDFVQTMPFHVLANTFEDDWVNANSNRKELVRKFSQVYANQIAVAENRFLHCQPVMMPDRDVLTDLKENVLRLEHQYPGQTQRASHGAAEKGTSGASKGGPPGAAPTSAGSQAAEGGAAGQAASPTAHGNKAPAALGQFAQSLAFGQPGNLGYPFPGLGALGSPKEQYSALLGSLGSLQHQVAAGGASPPGGTAGASPHAHGPSGAKPGKDVAGASTGARRDGAFVTTASAANPQNLVVIRRDVEEKLYRVVDYLRQTDKTPTVPVDDRHAQMFTWNENMALLLCALLQESCKNPFKTILRNFNRAVTEGASLSGAGTATRRPVRDRSSLRKRLQKMLHREQLSKDWESTRRASANLFVNSSKKRLQTEPGAAVDFLREPVVLVEDVFVGLNPSVPAVGVNS